MPLDEELIKILACPETKEPVSLASQDVIDKVNAAIAEGKIVNRGEQKVAEPIEAGLVREDGKFLYPVRDGIPRMLIDEALALEQLS